MFAIPQKIKTSPLFKRPEHFENWKQIVLWWESRRLPFNLIVGATGILTCVFLLGEILLAEKIFGDDGGGSPILAVFGVFAYGIMANICFTGGWISELLARHIWKEKAEHLGEIAFILGIAFSVILTLVPVLIFSLLLLIKIVFPKL